MSSHILCAVCKVLNIEPDDFYVQEAGPLVAKDFEKEHNIGRLHELYSRALSCGLCRLFATCLGYESVEKCTAAQMNGEYLVYWQEDGQLYGTDQPCGRVLRIRPVSYLHVPKGRDGSRVCLLQERASATTDDLFLARHCAPTIDSKLLKKWFQKCLSWHGSTCSTPATTLVERHQTEGKVMKSLRVIDCWNLNLTVTNLSHEEYLALSYVWGKRPMLTLNQANLSILSTRRALKLIWDQVPRTIQDSIRLTSTLGRRYLWVDSLCIVQDDIAERTGLILQMDKIYDQACLTIVALDGDNANAGLKGFRRRSRTDKPIAQLDGGAKVTSIFHLADELQGSVYDTRAWTYQERRMSRRCLFFSKHSVMFACEAAVWKEDVCLEHFDVISHGDRLVLVNPTLGVSERRLSTSYILALSEYARRDLTNEMDVINASSGILFIGLETQQCFNTIPKVPNAICGLPLVCFDWAMLWMWSPAEVPKRRHPELPSWSWCGWQCVMTLAELLFEDQSIKNFQHEKTWIRWHLHGRGLISGQEHTICLNPDTSDPQDVRFPKDRFPPLSIATTAPLASEAARDIAISPIGAMLSFMTMTIDLKIYLLAPFTGMFRMWFSIGLDKSDVMGYINLPEKGSPISGSRFRFAAICLASEVGLKSGQPMSCNDRFERAYHVIMTEIPKSDDEAVERINIGILRADVVEENPLSVWRKMLLS